MNSMRLLSRKSLPRRLKLHDWDPFTISDIFAASWLFNDASVRPHHIDPQLHRRGLAKTHQPNWPNDGADALVDVSPANRNLPVAGSGNFRLADKPGMICRARSESLDRYSPN
jgi:hypothetical protein